MRLHQKRTSLLLAWVLAFCAVLQSVSQTWDDADPMPIGDPGLDISRVVLGKTDAGSIVAIVRFARECEPNRVRFLFGSGRFSSRDSAEWLIERGQVYRRNASVPGWAWDEWGRVLAVAHSNHYVCELSVGLPVTGWWRVETFDEEGSVVDAAPRPEMATYDLERAPILSERAVHGVAGWRDWVQAIPVGAAACFRMDLVALKWTAAESLGTVGWEAAQIPISVRLSDDSGMNWHPVVFTSRWEAVGWTRWDGQATQVSVIVRYHSVTNELLQIFLSAQQPKFLNLEVSVPGVTQTLCCTLPCHPNDRAAEKVQPAQRDVAPIGPSCVVFKHGTNWYVLGPDPQEPVSFTVSTENVSNAAPVMQFRVALIDGARSCSNCAVISTRLMTLPEAGRDTCYEAIRRFWGVPRWGAQVSEETGRAVSGWPSVPAYLTILFPHIAWVQPDELEKSLSLYALSEPNMRAAANATRVGAVLDRTGHWFVESASAGDGVRIIIPWSLDPDFMPTEDKPGTPAAFVWSSVTAALGRAKTDGVFIRFRGLDVPDYSLTTLRFADYPVSWAKDVPAAAVPVRSVAAEFLKGARAALEARGGRLGVWFEETYDPFVAALADLVVLDGLPMRIEDADAFLLGVRAACGSRPLLLTQSPRMRLEDSDEEKAALELAFWGCWPAPRDFQRLEKFSALFPIIGTAEWGGCVAAGPDCICHIWHVPNKAAFVVVVNRSYCPATVPIAFDAAGGDVAIDLLSGEILWQDHQLKVYLAPRDQRLLCLVSEDRFGEVREWLADRLGRSAVWGLALENMAEIDRGLKRHLRLSAIVPRPMGSPGVSEIQFAAENISDGALRVGSVRVIGKEFWSGPDHVDISAFGRTGWVVYVDGMTLKENPWLECEWVFGDSPDAPVCRYKVRPVISEPIFVCGNVVPGETVGRERIARVWLWNATDEPQEAWIRWSGDMGVGRRVVRWERRGLQVAEIPLKASSLEEAEIFLRVEHRKKLLAAKHLVWRRTVEGKDEIIEAVVRSPK